MGGDSVPAVTLSHEVNDFNALRGAQPPSAVGAHDDLAAGRLAAPGGEVPRPISLSLSQTSLRTVRSPQPGAPRTEDDRFDQPLGDLRMNHLLHGVALAVLTTTCAQAAMAQDPVAPATPTGEDQAGATPVAASPPDQSQGSTQAAPDRKSGVEGKRVDLGGRRIIKKKRR